MTLHNCPSPGAALESWLSETRSIVANYGHILLEQACDADEGLVASLVSYFESAHSDARTVIHDEVGIDLHPDAGAEGVHAAYPSSLPMKARRGLFGEVMAGVLTEHYEFIGKHDWKVPVFLFRHDADATAYLFALARDEKRKRQVRGRPGSDFLAVVLNDDGEVVRYLSGEAKWRKNLQPSVVDALMLGKKKKNTETKRSEHDGKGIWNQVNTDIHPPQGLKQLQKILKELDPEGYGAAIVSLDKALVLKDPTPLPCTNLIFISGNDFPTRGQGHTLLESKKIPGEYTSKHDLQVVELILENGEDLIDRVYNALWSA